LRKTPQLETARKQTHADGTGAVKFLVPVIAGGALAAYSPNLAMGAGGLTVAVAAIFKKGASWWVVGILIVLLGLFFYWSDQNDEKASKDPEPEPKPILL
jgi:cell division protein FtsW (lipid II flippase)